MIKISIFDIVIFFLMFIVGCSVNAEGTAFIGNSLGLAYVMFFVLYTKGLADACVMMNEHYTPLRVLIYILLMVVCSVLSYGVGYYYRGVL